MFYLFTTQACPNCPKAKQLVTEKNPEAELVDASSPEGLDLARKFNVAQVPTLLEAGDDSQIIQQHSGIDEIIKYLE